MTDNVIQALKAAVKQTLSLAAIGLLVLGSTTVGLAMVDVARTYNEQGIAWLAVGALLMVFSRLAPPPTARM